METNQDRVLRHLAACAGIGLPDQQSCHTTLADLDVDSLARLELAARLEDETGLQIPDDAVSAYATPASLAEYLDEVGAAPAAPVRTPLETGDEPTTDARIEIGLPLEEVWAVTNDLTQWTRIFSEYESVEILQTSGDTQRFRLTMKPDAAGNVWSWVSERRADPVSHTVLARRVETGWFAHMTIHWSYAATAAGTEMRWRQWFDMRSDSPIPFEAMVERIRANSAVQLDHIRAVLEADRLVPAGTA